MKLFKSLKNSIKKHPNGWFLTAVVFIFVLLRLPSLIEPYWYGDEGIYQVIGMAMRDGRVLYAEIWDNKPPLLYALYALVNGDLFAIRVLSLIFGAGAVVAFYFLAKKIFTARKAIYISTIIFMLGFGLPIFEGNIANAENFMLLPIILAFYFVIPGEKEHRVKYFVFAGLLMGFAFMTKIVAIFDLAAVFLFMIVLKYFPSFEPLKKTLLSPKKFIKDFKNELIFVGSFLVIPIIISLYFLGIGAFHDYYRGVFQQNVGYVGYENQLLFPMGELLIKIIVLGVVIGCIVDFRKKIGVAGVLIYLWLTLSLFNALFSARPYTHYLLVFLPSFAMFIGYLWQQKRMLNINLVILFVLVAIIAINFNFYGKIGRYYANYVMFVYNSKNVDDYRAFFDGSTPRDYDIANFIKSNTTDSEEVFLWSDSGQIYALADKLPPGRYIVAYHITSYPDAVLETKRAIDEKKPKYIIQTKDSPELKDLLPGYELKYTIGNTRFYERQL